MPEFLAYVKTFATDTMHWVWIVLAWRILHRCWMTTRGTVVICLTIWFAQSLDLSSPRVMDFIDSYNPWMRNHFRTLKVDPLSTDSSKATAISHAGARHCDSVPALVDLPDNSKRPAKWAWRSIWVSRCIIVPLLLILCTVTSAK
jgi:hypothetical protein